MAGFFPRHTVDLKFEEPAAFRRFSFSLVEMALVTGVVTRLYRSLVLTHGVNSWWYLGLTFGVGMLFYMGMATAHLANFPIHRWTWRAPAFAALGVVAEMATSALLIALGREPNGTVRAAWADWPAMAGRALVFRVLLVSVWALLLAGIVLLVRRSGVAVPDLEDEAEQPEG
ncbi:MAG TPA: hypothetical protein VGD77_04815 [Gemmatimonadaceae bacterium]